MTDEVCVLPTMTLWDGSDGFRGRNASCAILLRLEDASIIIHDSMNSVETTRILSMTLISEGQVRNKLAMVSKERPKEKQRAVAASDVRSRDGCVFYVVDYVTIDPTSVMPSGIKSKTSMTLLFISTTANVNKRHVLFLFQNIIFQN